MDELPFPDYSLIDFRHYLPFSFRDFKVSLEVGRGCPFLCTFCSTASMWERDYRVKSPERIFQEMQWLNSQYGFTFFDFIHDNFTTSKKFVNEFCDYMAKHNTSGWKWGSSSRTDCIDIDRLERMHRVGLCSLFFGIETGSERMQKIIHKNLNFDKFNPILQRANQLGVQATTAFILGFPEEVYEDIDETLLKALRYKTMGTALVQFSKLTALTGTQTHQEYGGKLRELNLTSTMLDQDYGFGYIQSLIREHVDLFSFFYHVPHPVLSRELVQKLGDFSQLSVDVCPKKMLQVLSEYRLTPTQLFLSWDCWAQKNGIPYDDYRKYRNSDFERHFEQFIQSEMKLQKPGTFLTQLPVSNPENRVPSLHDMPFPSLPAG